MNNDKKNATGSGRYDHEGNPYFEITDKRRISLMTFRERPRVDLREFY